jgi:hypothetical protein
MRRIQGTVRLKEIDSGTFRFQAFHRESPLLTADQNMREHYSAAVW